MGFFNFEFKPRMAVLLFCLALFLPAFCACTATPTQSVTPEETGNPPAAGTPLTFAFATDIHLYSPLLFDNGPLFGSMLYGADSKMTQYSAAIMEAFVADVIAQKPTALILGGDISFNGEQASHQLTAQLLAPLKAVGIPVLVIPGNHDINSLHPQRYEGNKVFATEGFTPEEFYDLYMPFGGADAIAFDEDTMSYFYPVAEDFYILMLDASIYKTTVEDDGTLCAATLLWVEECLKKAQAQGATVLSVTHQNLLQHTFAKSVYMVREADALLALFTQYGVQLNLSGHIHVQHILQQGGFTEIATQALSLYPCQYGWLEVDSERNITYMAKETPVAAWALATGNEDEKLLAFDETGERFFYVTAARKALEEIYFDPALTTEEKTQMADFIGLVNPLYFSGRLHTAHAELLQHPGLALWAANAQRYAFGNYMVNLMANPPLDACSIYIPAKK